MLSSLYIRSAPGLRHLEMTERLNRERREESGGVLSSLISASHGLRFQWLTERFGSMNIDIAHRFRQSNRELNGSVIKIPAMAWW